MKNNFHFFHLVYTFGDTDEFPNFLLDPMNLVHVPVQQFVGNDICFEKKYFYQKSTPTPPQVFVLKLLSVVPPGGLFDKNYFFSKHISFDSVFRAELDFDVEILFPAFILPQIVDFCFKLAEK